jgi:hypothetical protein
MFFEQGQVLYEQGKLRSTPGKITPRLSSLIPIEQSIKFPVVEQKTAAGTAISLPLPNSPFIVAVYFRAFGKVLLSDACMVVLTAD